MQEDQIRHYEDKLKFEIDSWDLLEAQKSNQSIVAIDARGAQAYEKEHIRGAISLPHRLMTEEGTASLGRGPLYVVYCDGIGCNASTNAALKMAKLGFSVKELIGGLDWWKKSGFPTEGSAVAPTRTKPDAAE